MVSEAVRDQRAARQYTTHLLVERYPEGAIRRILDEYATCWPSLTEAQRDAIFHDAREDKRAHWRAHRPPEPEPQDLVDALARDMCGRCSAGEAINEPVPSPPPSPPSEPEPNRAEP